jgi:hypothetical protein
MGFELLHRTTRTLKLSEAGERLQSVYSVHCDAAARSRRLAGQSWITVSLTFDAAAGGSIFRLYPPRRVRPDSSQNTRSRALNSRDARIPYFSRRMLADFIAGTRVQVVLPLDASERQGAVTEVNLSSGAATARGRATLHLPWRETPD